MNKKNNCTLLTANERKAVEAVKKSVSAAFEVDSFMLFGSKARGDAAPDSDVDLLIVTREELDCNGRDRISDLVFASNLEHDTSISGVVVSKEEWESELWSILPFRLNVLREGIVLA